MQRRTVLAAAGCVFFGVGVGCLSATSTDPDARIHDVELQNHRRDESPEYSVRIDRDGKTVFEQAGSLEPAGSGDSTDVFDRPVDGPGTYEVVVRAAGDEASPETSALVSGDQACLGLTFYLTETALQWDHRAYDECV